MAGFEFKSSNVSAITYITIINMGKQRNEMTQKQRAARAEHHRIILGIDKFFLSLSLSHTHTLTHTVALTHSLSHSLTHSGSQTHSLTLFHSHTSFSKKALYGRQKPAESARTIPGFRVGLRRRVASRVEPPAAVGAFDRRVLAHHYRPGTLLLRHSADALIKRNETVS